MKAQCLSNLKQQNIAMLQYAEDFDGRLPRRSNWMDATDSFLRRYSTAEFDWTRHCPLVQREIKRDRSLFGFAFNSRIEGKEVKELSDMERTPLIFESSNLSRNASDPVLTLPNPGRHGGKNCIGYADGHAKVRPDAAAHP
jgi:prepilin-type processing-associated H-X9-DG protein